MKKNFAKFAMSYKMKNTLNKKNLNDKLLNVLHVLDNTGLDDALLCLQSVKGHDKEIWTYAVRRARQSIHLQSKHYVNDFWKQVEEFVKDNILIDELRTAFNKAFTNGNTSSFFTAGSCASAAASWALYEISKDAARKASKETAWQCAWGPYPDWENVYVNKRAAKHSAQENEIKTQKHYLRLLCIGQKE